ncbi:MAG TPA: hypothetical protein VIC84_09860 [Blastocatellia bacterium]
MRKQLSIAFFIGLIAALPVSTGHASCAADISGTWIFSVDLDGGGHGDPTFVFKQEGEKLTGTYNGPLGEYKVTGAVAGAKAVFGFDFKQDDMTGKATYTATIESPTKMKGTVEFVDNGEGERGKWTATKKE